MGFFGLLFWMVVLWFIFRAWRRSQSCAVSGPSGSGSWYPSEEHRYGDRTQWSRSRPDERQEYIESLEARLSELEERLDFTERLLAGRRESA